MCSDEKVSNSKMFRFVTVLLAVAALGDAASIEVATKLQRQFPDGRIVGGTETTIQEFPYQLSLRSWNSHICGASIISEYWAVTAAHCTDGQTASRLTLQAGSTSRLSGGTIHAVASIIGHPSYNSRTIDNDISLIRVSTPFVYSSSVQPVGLPAANEAVADGTYAVVTGWGTLSSGSSSLPTNLMMVAVPTVNQATCNSAYWGDITDQMLCAGYLAGGKDACQGDSGGPLVADGKLIGVVSWGIGCATRNYPGVYARTAVFRDWIATNTGV